MDERMTEVLVDSTAILQLLHKHANDRFFLESINQMTWSLMKRVDNTCPECKTKKYE